MTKVVTLMLHLLCCNAASARAQDWGDVQRLPPDTTLRIVATDGELRGRMTSVDDTRLTVLARGRPWVIPRDRISRIEREIRDPLWNGMIAGGLASLALRIAFHGEACARTPEPRCTVQGVLTGAGLGAFIDFQIRRHPVVYQAPQPALTLLRWSF